METTFRFADDTFSGFMKITAGGRTSFFRNEITIRYEPCRTLTVELECVGVRAYAARRIRNPLLRVLLYLPACVALFLLSVFVFFADTEDTPPGISAEKVFADFSPFTVKKTFAVSDPDGAVVLLRFAEAEYDPAGRRYGPPDLLPDGGSAANAICVDSQIAFSASLLRAQWCAYTLPAFCTMWAVLALLLVLCIVILAKVLREIPESSAAFNAFGLAGMTASLLVVLALSAALTVVFVRLHRVYGEIAKNHD